MARASSGVGRAGEPRRSSTRMALPAPFMRSIVRPASGWREIKPRSPFAVRAPAAPRRRADLSIARAPSRVTASRKPSSSIGEAAARAAASAASEGTGAARRFVLERRQRALPEGDLVDASPAEMRVHPVHDHRGAVLRLERKGAFDPQHQGRGNGRRVGIAFGGPRRPLQLDRPGVTRKRLRRQWPASRRSGSSRPSRARPAPRRSTRG